ncbi:MAG TPA: hypothetical protein VG406_23235 [Isosphaeraceae bacterium]|jgi:hypothetical protein|nr:hypothetical protein [Isosphaeraceae bacterium]
MGVRRGRIGAAVLAAALVLAPAGDAGAQRGGGGHFGGGVGGAIGAHYGNLGFRGPGIWGGNWGGYRSFYPGYGGLGWGWGWPYYGYSLYSPYYSMGWGWPGYGFGYGWGNPFFGMGMSPFDQWAYRQQMYALNVSRYNVQTAQAVNAYQQANLFQQEAVGQALSNMKQYQAIQEKYSPKTGARIGLPGEEVPVTALLPRNGMFNDDGTLRWPEIAPKNRYRDEVDTAVDAALKDAQANGGKASVTLVAEAKNRLQDYGQPALRLVRQQTARAVGNRLRDFLNSLDYFLDNLAEPEPDAKGKAS